MRLERACPQSFAREAQAATGCDRCDTCSGSACLAWLQARHNATQEVSCPNHATSAFACSKHSEGMDDASCASEPAQTGKAETQRHRKRGCLAIHSSLVASLTHPTLQRASSTTAPENSSISTSFRRACLDYLTSRRI